MAKDSITPERTSDNSRDMDFLADVPLTIQVVLGGSMVSVKDLIQLQKGSVIELEKLAGEPLDVHLNGQSIAKGEVVVINDKYGIRLTDIVD